MEGRSGRGGFHLLDVAGLIVGYALASMLIRAYWPAPGSPRVFEAMVIALVFLWLGLAMSGPVILLIRRPPDEHAEGVEPRPGVRSWAELSWMIIGFYWVGLTVLVVPVRMHGTRFLDSALLGLFPVLAGVGLWLSSHGKNRPPGGEASWTHRAGVTLIVTWPFAWMALILLGKTLL